MVNCASCGMACEPGEFHPYAACLMYRACGQAVVVRANLKAGHYLLGLPEKGEVFVEAYYHRHDGKVTFERKPIDQAPDWVQRAHERFHGADASVDADNAKAADRACLAMIAQGFAWNGENWERPEGARRLITVRDSVRGTARVSKVFPGDVIAEEYDTESAPQPPAEAHCATCSCVPGMTPAVRFDTTPAEKEGAVRDHLIRMGWTPPAEAQAAPPSAPVGVEDHVKALRQMWQQCANDRRMIEADALNTAIEALAQQPAAVDSEMVKRAVNAYDEATGEGWQMPCLQGMRAALTAALTKQPAAVDGDNPYPAPRNRQEAAALAKLALAYLGVTSAHIDAAVARCETDLAAQPGGGK